MRQVVIIHFPHVDKYVNRGKGNANKHHSVFVKIFLYRFHLKKKVIKKIAKKIVVNRYLTVLVNTTYCGKMCHFVNQKF